MTLSNHVEELYRVFAHYNTGSRIVGCTCCVKPEWEEQLSNPNIREIPQEIVDTFVWKALTTWGNDDDFFRILPRILELTAQTGSLEDILGSKMSMSGLWDAPIEEQHAVLGFLVACWRAYLKGELLIDKSEFILISLPRYVLESFVLATSEELSLEAASELREIVVDWTEDEPADPDDPESEERAYKAKREASLSALDTWEEKHLQHADGPRERARRAMAGVGTIFSMLQAFATSPGIEESLDRELSGDETDAPPNRPHKT